MANYGTTSITVTGPQDDRAALRTALAATARGDLAFSLRGIAPEVWRGDGLLRDADLVEVDDTLRLIVCMAHDADYLPLIGALSKRYSALRFAAWFDCEGTWPNFTAAAHAGGREIYNAWFETTHLASLIVDPVTPRCMWAIGFYQRTTERDLAAAEFLGARLTPFLRRPDIAAGWRRSDDEPSHAVYLLPSAAADGHLVLAIDAFQGTATLLHNVDQAGGYRSAEPLPLDHARTRMPELAAEIDRLVRETALVSVRYQVRPTLASRGGVQDDEIAF